MSSNVLIHNVLGKYPIITVCIGSKHTLALIITAQSYLVEPTDDTNHGHNESHFAPVASYPGAITFPVN